MIRDRALVIEDELERYTGAKLTVRDNDEGTWQIDGIPADDLPIEWLLGADSMNQDAGIVVLRDGVEVFSGPIKFYQYVDGPDGRKVSISGINDLGVLADRHVLPEYTGPPYTLAYDTIGPVSAEEAIQHYVHRHAGPGATTARWIRGLTMGAFSGLGTTVTRQFRMTNLLAAIQDIALAGDGLRFDVVQIGSGLRRFDTYGRNDLRNQIYLSVQGGNLQTITSTEQAPSANYVYVMGKGELESRTIVEQGDDESIARYGRIETVVSIGQSDDPVELANALASALEAGREQFTVEVEAAKDEDYQLWENYQLGDQVTAVTHDGREISCYVMEATVEFVPQAGAVITPVLSATRVAPSSRDVIRSLGQRLAHIERTNENGFSIGMVIPWYRPAGEIPAGFRFADGEEGRPDLRQRFLLWAGSTIDVGDTGGLPMVDDDVTIQLQHNHAPGDLAFPHTHPHKHGPGGLLFPHTHSHAHTITQANLAHTHASQAHTHPASTSGGTLAFTHTHGGIPIGHTHAGPIATGGVNIDSTAVGHASLGSGTVDHHHNIVSGITLGATSVSSTTQSGTAITGDTGSAGYTGSPSAATWTGGLTTESDATAATPGLNSGQTGSPEDVSQSNSGATGHTGNALEDISVLPPYVALIPIYRIV